jgi:spore coat polysaccharide biosynthesis protein SpsF
MTVTPGIILQARFASTRLPGKALAPIGARTILEHCLLRLCAGGAARVVLATTTGPEDDALQDVACRLGVPVFRGDVEDVLGRYAAAASYFRLDPVIRATADNPAVDIDAPRRVLSALAATGADYVREDGLPIGAAVEGLTHAALWRAAMAARLPYDREHVTTYIKSQPKSFRIAAIDAPAALRRPDVRVTVDTPVDLDQVRDLFQRATGDLPSLERLIAAAEWRDGREVA